MLPLGPSEPPALQTARWLFRPIAFLEDCRRKYGDAFSVRFLGFQTPMVMLSHPDDIRALYTERAHGLPPGRTVALRPVMGARSVLLLEGREHMARRKLMLPSFQGERMRAYESLIRSVADEEIAKWPKGEAFSLHPHMQAVTLEVIMRAVFGVSDPERLDKLRRLLPELLGQSASVGLQVRVLLARRRKNGSDPFRDLRVVLDEIDSVLLAEVAERRTDPELESREDILSLLSRATFEDGTQMDDTELRDQLVTLLLAGHETTATALAWTMDLLLKQPEKLARLEEGDEAYLRAVCWESLRLRPVVPLAGRRLNAPLESERVQLEPGTDVTPAIWLTHTRDDLYPEPYAFRPERFLDKPPSTYGWIPFGGGVRRCLGAAFAEFEMRTVLRAIVEAGALKPASKRPERIVRRNVTFSPRHGTRVIA